jgi:hypothetical protein
MVHNNMTLDNLTNKVFDNANQGEQRIESFVNAITNDQLPDGAQVALDSLFNDAAVMTAWRAAFAAVEDILEFEKANKDSLEKQTESPTPYQVTTLKAIQCIMRLTQVEEDVFVKLDVCSTDERGIAAAAFLYRNIQESKNGYIVMARFIEMLNFTLSDKAEVFLAQR